jgi:hypothetical protein
MYGSLPMTRSQNEYRLIGKLLMKTEPDKAEELLSSYQNKGIDTDLGNIHGYYLAFCRLQGVDPATYRGKIYKTSLVDVRKLFISVIMHIYCPQVFEQNPRIIRFPYRLANTLSSELRIANAAASLNMHELINFEKIYSEYKQKVEETTALLLEKRNIAG